jgi:hypothetical protein
MKGFISYAHEDYALAQEFLKHLAAIGRAYNLKFFIDDDIQGGQHWNDEIGTAIDDADVFLLLCSPNFIFSTYIHDTELPAIRKRHKRGALVVTVVLEPSAWQFVTGKLQAIPREDGQLKAISAWKPRKKGMDCAREQIARAIESHFGITPKAVNWGRR